MVIFTGRQDTFRSRAALQCIMNVMSFALYANNCIVIEFFHDTGMAAA